MKGEDWIWDRWLKAKETGERCLSQVPVPWMNNVMTL